MREWSRRLFWCQKQRRGTNTNIIQYFRALILFLLCRICSIMYKFWCIFSLYCQQEKAFRSPVMWLWTSHHYFCESEERVWCIGQVSGENGGNVDALITPSKFAPILPNIHHSPLFFHKFVYLPSVFTCCHICISSYLLNMMSYDFAYNDASGLWSLVFKGEDFYCNLYYWVRRQNLISSSWRWL